MQLFQNQKGSLKACKGLGSPQPLTMLNVQIPCRCCNWQQIGFPAVQKRVIALISPCFLTLIRITMVLLSSAILVRYMKVYPKTRIGWFKRCKDIGYKCTLAAILPACRRLLFPLLHKGNRRRLHVSKPPFGVSTFSIFSLNSALLKKCKVDLLKLILRNIP